MRCLKYAAKLAVRENGDSFGRHVPFIVGLANEEQRKVKTGNNSQCPCGSGRKYKRCCRDKKDRTIVVEGSFDKLTTSDCFTFDVRDGRFRIFNNGQEQTPDKAVSMLSYDREKGPKILSKMPKVGNVTRAYVDAGLLQFDKIVSIDTNSKAFESDTVCVMATVMMTPSKILGNVVLKDPRTIAIEFWNPTDLPERVGWLLAMQAILDTEEYASGARFGVIIDSDLGNLENYNAREMEIVPGFVLPDQMTLIYGSADNKNDTAINKMINMTDRASNSVHRRIAAAGYVRSGDTYSTFFTDWRQWSDIELSV